MKRSGVVPVCSCLFQTKMSERVTGRLNREREGYFNRVTMSSRGSAAGCAERPCLSESLDPGPARLRLEPLYEAKPPKRNRERCGKAKLFRTSGGKAARR